MILLPDIELDSTSNETLKMGAQRIVEIVRPSWKCNEIAYKIYTNGITNKLIGAWSKQKKDDQILLRVYGEKTELFIDRNAEIENIKLLYKHGCGPELYATFKNGLCYAFIHGVPLSSVTIRESNIWKAVGKQMASLHNIKVETKEACLFPKLKKFINLLPAKFQSGQNVRLEEVGIDKLYIEGELQALESDVAALASPVVFCHNDILLTNIIWNTENKTASFIDYEYGAANFQAFDIGNHFNEFAGVDTVDYSLYPDISFQRDWLRNYLSHYYACNEENITFNEIEKWRSWVNKLALVSHVFWGTWALVQSCQSSIDFNFLEYCITRFQEYRKRKVEFLDV